MTDNAISVLHVEDDAGDAELVKRLLSKSTCKRFELTWIESLEIAAQALKKRPYDVLLLDRGLPGTRELEGLIRMRTIDERIPIVMLTDMNLEEVALRALDHSAQDYLIKGSVTTDNLVRAITYAMQRQSLMLNLSAAQRLLERKNRRLTKLYRTAHQFVDNVSHEFRTPLTVVKEYVSLIKDGVVGPVSTEQRQMLTVVEDRADDLNTMVDDMLDISKLESGMLGFYRKNCDVCEIVAHVRQALERKAAVKGVELIFDVEEDLPMVYCDSEKTGRVIINLVTNAIKFSGQPGKVRMTCSQPRAHLGVEFSISDNGPGISAENQQKLFRRFQQLGAPVRGSTKGFGLGLSIAKELVELNLGDITVESQLGKGSTFSFTLPPADVEEVMRRYLQRIEHLHHGSSDLSLVRAEVASPLTEAETDEFDDLLSYLLRANDLLFRVSSTRWLIVLSVPDSELPKFRQRASDVLREAGRNRLGGPLPTMEFHPAGTWRVSHGRDQILSLIRENLHCEELAHA